MKVELEGCWAKVQRADMHLQFLHERIEAFMVEGGPHGRDAQPDSETGEIIIYGEISGEPPWNEWGAIIGDIVHNLRSALDHLVWQLTIWEGHTPPPNPIPKGSRWRSIQFPVYLKPHPTGGSGKLIPWHTTKEPQCLWGIGPRLRAEFQGLQPFIHGQSACKQRLALLNELWSIDKHRHLHPTLFYVGLHDAKSRSPELKFRGVEKSFPGPFKGRAEIGRVQVVGGLPRDFSVVEMNMELILTFDVAFEQGPPADGAPVIETFREIRGEVADILYRFDALTGLPVPHT